MLNMIEQVFKLLGIGGKMLAQLVAGGIGCIGLVLAAGLSILVGVGALGFIGMLL